MGMELELTPEKVANLTPIFDFAQLQRDFQKNPEELELLWTHVEDLAALHLNEADISKNYLRNSPAALDQLPPTLRQQLTAGLKLEKRILTEKNSLVDATGKKLEQQTSAVLNAEKPKLTAAPRLILPGEENNPAPKAKAPVDESLLQKSGSFEVPNHYDWETLYQRWEALPRETRYGAMKWDLLGPQEKSMLALVGNGYLRLRPDLPEKDQALFSRLAWERDHGTLEFTHREPVTDVQTFLSDLRQLAARAGVEREVFDPESTRMRQLGQDGKVLSSSRPWGSMHYHVSLPDRNYQELVAKLNENLLVRRLELGITNDLGGNRRYGYMANIKDRGLLRLFEPNHFEVRAHYEPLEKELARVLTATFAGRQEGLAQVTADTAQRLDEKMLLQLSRSSHEKTFLDLFEQIPDFEKKLFADLKNPGPNRPAAAALLMKVVNPTNATHRRSLEKGLEEIARQPLELAEFAKIHTDIFYEIKNQPELRKMMLIRLAQSLPQLPENLTGPAFAAVANRYNWPEESPVKEVREPILAFFTKAVDEGKNLPAKASFDFLRSFPVDEKTLTKLVTHSLAEPGEHRSATIFFLKEKSEKDPGIFQRFSRPLLGLPAAASNATVEERTRSYLLSESSEHRVVSEKVLKGLPNVGAETRAEIARALEASGAQNEDLIYAAYRHSEKDANLRTRSIQSLLRLLEEEPFRGLQLGHGLNATDEALALALEKRAKQIEKKTPSESRQLKLLADKIRANRKPATASSGCGAGYAALATKP